jgi:hypothetical protein
MLENKVSLGHFFLSRRSSIQRLASYTADKNRLICSCLSVTFFFSVLSDKVTELFAKSQSLSSRQNIVLPATGSKPIKLCYLLSMMFEPFFGPIDPLPDVHPFSSTIFLSKMLGFFCLGRKNKQIIAFRRY